MGQPAESQPESRMPVVKSRLLDQVRATIRTKHYCLRAVKAYGYWIKRFIYFTGKRHPAELRDTFRGSTPNDRNSFVAFPALCSE
jgi:hypothetical protein